MNFPASLTDSTGGAATTTLAACTNTHALTDSGGGTADLTVSVMTAANAITDSGGGTNATNTVSAISDIALSTANTYADSDVNTAVNTALGLAKDAVKCLSTHQNTTSTCVGVVKDNIKEITTELALQKSLNTVFLNALATLAAQFNKFQAIILNAAQMRNGD